MGQGKLHYSIGISLSGYNAKLVNNSMCTIDTDNLSLSICQYCQIVIYIMVMDRAKCTVR